MTMSAQRATTVLVNLNKDSFEEADCLPWFSYQVSQPADLPPAAARPHMRTSRLLIRPFVPDDLEALHKLRRDPELQKHSKARGLPDKSIEQTRHHIELLQEPHDDSHWYFGAFLAETGELIGEGGLPDIDGRNSRSGWPEADFLISREHQRKGYGTELYQAVIGAWWALPRARRRRQLHPYVVPGVQPGEKLTDCIEFGYETSNTVGAAFYDKMAGDMTASVKGTVWDYDMREGRERVMTSWSGMTLTCPVPFVDPPEEDDGSGED